MNDLTNEQLDKLMENAAWILARRFVAKYAERFAPTSTLFRVECERDEGMWFPLAVIPLNGEEPNVDLDEDLFDYIDSPMGAAIHYLCSFGLMDSEIDLRKPEPTLET